MKLIECKSGNGFLELIKEVSFSIENYKKLKATDNLVYLINDDCDIKDIYDFNYFNELDYAYQDNTLFYQILFNHQSYTKEEIEYLLEQIDFNSISTYIYKDVVEEYFDIDDVTNNPYLKDKVNMDILSDIIDF